MMPIYFQRQFSQKSRRTPISSNRLESLMHQRMVIDLGQKEHTTSPQNINIKLQKHNSFTLKHNRLPQLRIGRDFGLTEEEKNVYGDRQLMGFDKIELLGRGGFALVWLAQQGNQKVALKQIAKPTQSKEAKYSYIKCDNVVSIHGIENSQKDTWIIQELGGKPLSKALYTMKGEFYKGERVYAITETPLFLEMYDHPQKFIELLKGILNGIASINDKNVTHFDLKPDNILLEGNIPKIIDFGSAFCFDDQEQFGMVTPEYMAPEVLDIMTNWTKYSATYNNQIEALIKIYGAPKVDVWSYGAIILDILHGVPNWLSYKGKIIRGGRTLIKFGLFAVKGREIGKIIQKQQQLQINAEVRQNCNFLNLTKQNQLIDLLKQCLAYDPAQRPDAKYLLKHDFFSQN